MATIGFAGNALELALSRELRRGERVVWQGSQIARLSMRAFGLYVFAVPWTAFALFWTAMASAGVSTIENDAGVLAWAFPLFGVPFILVGLAMMSAPFMPLFHKGKVLYAITSERVLKIRLGRSLDVISVPADRIGLVERHEGRDGSGSIKLAISVGRDSDGDKQTEHFELGEVADVMTAHDRIAELRERTPRPRELPA